VDVFSQKAVERHDWVQELSLGVKNQVLGVNRGETGAQVKLEWQVEPRRGFGSSQNPEAERTIPAPRQKHLGSVLLLMIPFRSR